MGQDSRQPTGSQDQPPTWLTFNLQALRVDQEQPSVGLGGAPRADAGPLVAGAGPWSCLQAGLGPHERSAQPVVGGRGLVLTARAG